MGLHRASSRPPADPVTRGGLSSGPLTRSGPADRLGGNVAPSLAGSGLPGLELQDDRRARRLWRGRLSRFSSTRSRLRWRGCGGRGSSAATRHGTELAARCVRPAKTAPCAAARRRQTSRPARAAPTRGWPPCPSPARHDQVRRGRPAPPPPLARHSSRASLRPPTRSSRRSPLMQHNQRVTTLARPGQGVSRGELVEDVLRDSRHVVRVVVVEEASGPHDRRG
jgi:hypothetical protein